MKINLEKFLQEANIDEKFYPGKRLVKSCRQEGEYKSHAVVLDWRVPDKIRIDLKAGLKGNTLEDKMLKKYPVCFQSPTFIEMDIVNDNKDDDDDTEKSSGSKGKKGSSGGGQKVKKKSLASMTDAFSNLAEGKIPDLAEVKKMVVMGKEIAKEAYQSVFKVLTEQISHAKITATELLAKAGSLVTKFMPPSFMEPTGDETANYKYDREKNENIGFRPSMMS